MLKLQNYNYLVTVSENHWNFIRLKWFKVLEENFCRKRLKDWFIDANCTILHTDKITHE